MSTPSASRIEAACYYRPKPLMPGDFPLWDELQLFHALDRCDKGNRADARRLMRAAENFLPYRLYWSGGSLIGDAPFGDYHWIFCVEIEQERRWNLPEFAAGYAYGSDPTVEQHDRDANPHVEAARRRSWDCGYILGLSHMPGREPRRRRFEYPVASPPPKEPTR